MATQEDKFVDRLRGALGSVLTKEADMFDYVKSLAPEQLQGAVGLALQPATKPRRDLAKVITGKAPAPVKATASAVGQMAEQAIQQNFSIPQGIADRTNALVEGLSAGATESARALAGPGPNLAAAAGAALGKAMPQAPQLAPKPAPVQGAQAAQAVATPSPRAPVAQLASRPEIAPGVQAPAAEPAAPDDQDVAFFEYAHDPNRKWGGFNPQSTVDQQKMAVIKQLRAQDPKATPQQIALRAYKIQYGQ